MRNGRRRDEKTKDEGRKVHVLARRGGERVGLPGYAWDERLHNYVDLSSGRMVSRSAINDLLRTATDAAAETMGNLGRKVANGAITPREFYEALQTTVRQAYNANAALARGGWAQMTPADWGRNGHALRMEYERLRNFAQEIQEGRLSLTQRPLSEAQIVARARLYADSAYGRYWQIKDERAREDGMREGRTRTAGDDRVCQICKGEERKGWQTIDNFRPPLYHGGCRCEAEYRQVTL